MPTSNAPLPRARSALRSWVLLATLLLAAILLPWLVFDTPFTRILQALFDATAANPWPAASLVIALLGADVLLPVPSSLVGVFAGSAFGLMRGAAILWTGLMLGCFFGHWLGARPGHALASRLVGTQQLAALHARFIRYGPAILIIARAVPVLAEASVIAAGAARMAWRPFLLTTALANTGVALAWAGLGSAAATNGSFLIVFIGLSLLPALGWAAWQRLKPTDKHT